MDRAKTDRIQWFPDIECPLDIRIYARPFPENPPSGLAGRDIAKPGLVDNLGFVRNKGNVMGAETESEQPVHGRKRGEECGGREAEAGTYRKIALRDNVRTYAKALQDKRERGGYIRRGRGFPAPGENCRMQTDVVSEGVTVAVTPSLITMPAPRLPVDARSAPATRLK